MLGNGQWILCYRINLLLQPCALLDVSSVTRGATWTNIRAHTRALISPGLSVVSSNVQCNFHRLRHLHTWLPSLEVSFWGGVPRPCPLTSWLKSRGIPSTTSGSTICRDDSQNPGKCCTLYSSLERIQNGDQPGQRPGGAWICSALCPQDLLLCWHQCPPTTQGKPGVARVYWDLVMQGWSIEWSATETELTPSQSGADILAQKSTLIT